MARHLGRRGQSDNRNNCSYEARNNPDRSATIKPLDIAIAGCGTAGMAAALLLARDGHRVTIFERFNTPRPIGSGLMLQPTGLAILDNLGLLPSIRACGAPISRLFGESDGRVVLDVRYAALSTPDLCAIGIHRAALFATLHGELVAAGVPIRTGNAVTGVNGRSLVFEGSSEGPFDILVDALGSRSPLVTDQARDLRFGALWANVTAGDAGFPSDALAQRYRHADVMAGVMPVGHSPHGPVGTSAFFWSLRADGYQNWLERGLDCWKAEVTHLWPATAEIVEQFNDPQQLTFARYAHRTTRRPLAGRLIHIGDSWHSASPQLGQGANMALLDAYALAAGLRRGKDVDDGLRRAVGMRHGHVRLYQWLTALLTPVYQSKSRAIPWLRDRLMAPVSQLWPFPRLQAALVSGLIGRPLERLGIRLAAPETDR